ncbi:hypothetical protein L581_1129 [Serratia fonticola AU-AP2C]|nr:hypothetical protein L581_1129 [Serratia fonticola AU-AP2C]
MRQIIDTGSVGFEMGAFHPPSRGSSKKIFDLMACGERH